MSTITSTGSSQLGTQLYEYAVGDDSARLCRDIPDNQCNEQPGNFVWQVLAQAFSKTGDVLSDTKVVLPWLMSAVGAPLFLIGLLVPIRESLALLPQMIVGGMIRRIPVRKGFWVASSAVEGLCIVLMGVLAAAGLQGAAAGWTIVSLLVVFSLARGVASVAAKDTLGKTISKGQRGRVSGYAAAASGLVAAIVGFYLALGSDSTRPEWLLYAMIIAAGAFWFVAAASFSMIKEYPGATEGALGVRDLVQAQLMLLVRDVELQKFLVARTLMISTALVGPLYVSLAQRVTGQALDGLGWLVLATGLASAVSSSVWGILSDASSRVTMALAATLAGGLGLGVVTALNFAPTITERIEFYAAIIFFLSIAHAGVRIGRKTHVVDLASGDHRAEYVALSNTLIGVFLLLTGLLVGGLLMFGLEVAVAALSILALMGAVVTLTMKEAQR